MTPGELGRYRLKRVLGRSARGEVWEAQDGELERRVVVKIMHSIEEDVSGAQSQFAREVRIAASLRHSNLAVVHDAGEVAGTCFMVMELVEGRSARALVGLPDTSIADKLRWIRQIGEGLAVLHQVGLVHRDVKPENVIIRPDGSACLVDFGIGKWTHLVPPPEEEGAAEEPDALESPPKAAAEAPSNLPPETRDQGVFDERSDQYAWAVMAYELLAGAAPADLQDRPLADRGDLPREVAAALDRARSASPEERFAKISEATELLVQPDAEEVTARSRAGGPRIPVVLAIVLALGIVVAAGFALGRCSAEGHARSTPSVATPGLARLPSWTLPPRSAPPPIGS